MEAIPEDKNQKLINLLGAKLHVLNVDFKTVIGIMATPFQKWFNRGQCLEHYHPECHFIEIQISPEGVIQLCRKAQY